MATWTWGQPTSAVLPYLLAIHYHCSLNNTQSDIMCVRTGRRHVARYCNVQGSKIMTILDAITIERGVKKLLRNLNPVVKFLKRFLVKFGVLSYT